MIMNIIVGISALIVGFLLPNNLSEGQTLNVYGIEYVRLKTANTVVLTLTGMPDAIGKEIEVQIAHLRTARAHSRDKCQKFRYEQARHLVDTLLTMASKISVKNLQRSPRHYSADIYVDGMDIKEPLILSNLATTTDKSYVCSGRVEYRRVLKSYWYRPLACPTEPTLDQPFHDNLLVPTHKARPQIEAAPEC